MNARAPLQNTSMRRDERCEIRGEPDLRGECGRTRSWDRVSPQVSVPGVSPQVSIPENQRIALWVRLDGSGLNIPRSETRRTNQRNERPAPYTIHHTPYAITPLPNLSHLNPTFSAFSTSSSTLLCSCVVSPPASILTSSSSSPPPSPPSTARPDAAFDSAASRASASSPPSAR